MYGYVCVCPYFCVAVHPDMRRTRGEKTRQGALPPSRDTKHLFSCLWFCLLKKEELTFAGCSPRGSKQTSGAVREENLLQFTWAGRSALGSHHRNCIQSRIWLLQLLNSTQLRRGGIAYFTLAYTYRPWNLADVDTEFGLVLQKQLPTQGDSARGSGQDTASSKQANAYLMGNSSGRFWCSQLSHCSFLCFKKTKPTISMQSLISPPPPSQQQKYLLMEPPMKVPIVAKPDSLQNSSLTCDA